jgi:hypothetical protein
LRLRATLLLVLLAGLPGRNATAGDTRLGAAVGSVEPDGVSRSIVVAGDLRFPLGERFAIQPDISYWKRTEAQLGISVSAEDLSFGLQGLFVVELDRIAFHVGGGVSLHHVTGNVELLGVNALSDSLNVIGPDLFAGVELTLSHRLRLFAGARYDWVDLDGDDPDRLDQTKLYAGFRLRL